MYHVVRNVASAGAIVALLACADAPVPTAASPSPSTLAAERAASGRVSTVLLHDECDPATFNAQLGAGTCTRSGVGVTWTNFVAKLTQLKRFPAWRMTPADLDVRVGDGFSAKNIGGEDHTFTEVEKFGGGIVPLLNQLSGNTEVAPECKALEEKDIIEQGVTSDTDFPTTPGDELYQCCIHPWMRMVVHIHASSSK
jgi:plastocyanin